MKPQFQHSRAHQFREPSLQLGYLADGVVGVFAGDPADELPGAGAHQDGVVVALVKIECAHDLGQLVEQHVAEGDAVVAHDACEAVDLDGGKLARSCACARRRDGVHAGLETVCRRCGIELLLARGFDLATLPAVDVVDDAYHAVLPAGSVVHAR